MNIGKMLLRLHFFLGRQFTYIYGFFIVGTPIFGLAYVYGYYFRGITDFTQLIQMYLFAMLVGVIVQVFLWLGFHPRRNKE